MRRLAVLLLFAATASATAATSVSVLTYHNDKARTGRNTNETVLTLANVNTNSFGVLFTYAVDGYVYAQPLLLANVTIPSNGVHNVVYIATEHDSVYAFDADSNTASNAAPLWQVSFINPSGGITPVPKSDVNCNDLVPEIGITSTPVIDPVGGTIYIVAKTKEVVSGTTNYAQRLHALDVATGAEKLGGPVIIQAAVQGTGYDSDGLGHVSLGPLKHLNRTALLLSNGILYFGFGSHCDIDFYHGWLFGFDAQTLATNAVFNSTLNGQRGGIWNTSGAASDTDGNVYVSTGNGTFDPINNNYGDSLLRFSTSNSLAVADYFTPHNQQDLNDNDNDLNSGGVVLLPDESGSVAHPHLVVCAGKEGTLYLVDRDNMGQFNATDDTQIVQSLPGAIGMGFDTPAYFNNTLYHIGVDDVIKAFTITNGSIVSTPSSQGSTVFGFPGATPSISANGTNDGIAWAIQSDASSTSGPSVLHAYNAADVSQELYNSSQAGSRDTLGGAVKFTVPTIANGKVYVGTESTLSVFGNFVAAPTITPNGGTFTNSVLVTLANTTPGAAVHYTLDNTIPTTNSALYTGPFSQTTSATVGARAFLGGVTGSAAVSANFTIISLQPPSASFTGSPTTGLPPLAVTFTDNSTGAITNRSWTFGDGGTTNTLNTTVAYTYNLAGTNTVTLVATGPLGARTNARVNYIVTGSAAIPPTAGFTATPTNGAAPLLVNFTDASAGSITNHSWTFGDGNTSGAVNPSHTYSNAGNYSVALTVSGPSGSSATNLPNLITVTNVVSTLPTVTILRPTTGMLYPPVTNLTITIVASAIANNGAAISKIEFFADSKKLGETTSNSGTNFLFSPTFGNHIIMARVTDTLGASNTSPSITITVGAKNSPLGSWEVTVSGADKGAQFVTFKDDFTASGFGIRLKTFGLDDVSGHWAFNPKGQVTGAFFEQTLGSTNWSGTLLGTAKSLKGVSGVLPTTTPGTYHWKGITAMSFRDLSGTWTGMVTVVKTAAPVSYLLSPNANDPAVFDIATSAAPGTVVGQLLVTSRNQIYGYVAFSGKLVTMSGAFNIRKLTMTLKGADSAGEKVKIQITQ